MSFYEKLTANYPRNFTDKFFGTDDDKKFEGPLDEALKFINKIQLKDTATWKKCVNQFRTKSDTERAWWSGEFWGKMMRGACFCYSYSKDPELFAVLKGAVEDLIATEDELGRITTYRVEGEFDGWDVWVRKYVLLGMQYFIEISNDKEFNQKVIDCMCRQLDYFMSKIGPLTEGKKPITKATRHWRGLNSSSILEPVVRLYNLTGEQRYLDYAGYIVSCGGTEVANIFDLAYENKLRLYQYPMTKAYEMTSCFVGLLEYYRIMKDEKHLEAIINYANLILEDELTVIGSAGCTHELFDHSAVRQANPYRGDPRAQETCVTVTLMQFFAQLNLITGDAKYVDAIERALYNGYLGAINTDGAIDTSAQARTYTHDHIESAKPFDSYSPLTPGIRGNGIGGFGSFGDGDYYGCCICIGPAGIGVAMKTAVMLSENGLVINLFEKGTVTEKLANGKSVKLDFDTAYPVCGKVKITVDTDNDDAFSILVRNPEWSKNTTLAVNGESVNVNAGYIVLDRVWQSGDVIEIEFDMRAKAVYPIPYGSQVIMNKVIWGANYMVATYDEEHPDTKNHIAIQRGPIMLAQDNRLGYSVDDAVSVKVNADGYVDLKICDTADAPYKCLLSAQVPTTDGGSFGVTDYASAGKTFSDESKMAVWFNTK